MGVSFRSNASRPSCCDDSWVFRRRETQEGCFRVARYRSDHGPSQTECKRALVSYCAYYSARRVVSNLIILLRLGMVLVKASVPSPDQLGTLFGLQQACFSFARGIAPASVSALYAFSTDHQVLSGYFVWLVLTGISLIAIPISMGIMDVPAPMQMLRAKSRSGKTRYPS